MARYIDLIFSDFAPDRGGAPWPENPGYLLESVNVRFTPNGYRSTYLDQFAAGSPAAVTNTPIAAAGFANTTNPRHYAGTAGKIYESSDAGATWFDNAGAAYTATDWDFGLFGTTVVAVNATDVPQAKDLSDAVANNFAALGGSPPTGTRIARVRDSLVIGNLPASYPWGLQWSSAGNPADWPTPGSATALARQAGSYQLQSSYGFVTDIVGGEKFGVVFQERAITRMTYVGGDIQFNFDVFERGFGTGYGHSAIVVGGFTYFISNCGIFKTDGYTVVPISIGRVEEAIISNLLGYPTRAVTIGNGVAYDARVRTIYWPFVAFTDALVSHDYLLGYDVVLGQFGIVKLAGTLLDGCYYSTHNAASIELGQQVPVRHRRRQETSAVRRHHGYPDADANRLRRTLAQRHADLWHRSHRG
jgi:hypothetical protein